MKHGEDFTTESASMFGCVVIAALLAVYGAVKTSSVQQADSDQERAHSSSTIIPSADNEYSDKEVRACRSAWTIM